MNFQAKNFSYITKEFGTFLDEVYAGSRQYLRSISAKQPSKLPANFAVDFPGLKDDFHLPAELSLAADNIHSSPLRISGPVSIWLHYDVSSSKNQATNREDCHSQSLCRLWRMSCVKSAEKSG